MWQRKTRLLINNEIKIEKIVGVEHACVCSSTSVMEASVSLCIETGVTAMVSMATVN